MAPFLAFLLGLHIWLGSLLDWGTGPETAQSAVWAWLATGVLLGCITAYAIAEGR